MELKSEKAFRIADLILRYQEETISEEEMEELRLWLKKSTEHQQQFENLNDRDYIRRKRELDLSINPAAAYTAFSERIARERPWSYRKLAWVRLLWAAVCAVGNRNLLVLAPGRQERYACSSGIDICHSCW